MTLLVSSDFLASDYCYDKETARAMERHAKEGTLVVAIIVRPCDWHDAPFDMLHAIPQDGKAVTCWTNRDEAWTELAQRLKIVVRRRIERIQTALRVEMEQSENAFLTPTRSPELEKLSQQQQMEPWKILQQTQTKIFEIQQEVRANQAAAASKMYVKWDEYIRG